MMHQLRTAWLAVLLIGAGAPLHASAAFPETFTAVHQDSFERDTVRIPVGPSADGQVPMRTLPADGERVVLRRTGESATLDIMAAVGAHLARAGFQTLFTCVDRDCGGFEFLAAMDLPTSPEMYVDLGDFRYLAAVQDMHGSTELIGVLVSRSRNAGFVQLTAARETMSRPEFQTASAATAAPNVRPEEARPVEEQLLAAGRAVLRSLEFASGSLTLSDAVSEELAELAGFLAANPGYAIVLVGHTDTTGDLESNLELSTKRAQAVLAELISEHGADPSQLTAEGIGYLSPRSTNEDDQGRARNRRVEAVLVRKREQ